VTVYIDPNLGPHYFAFRDSYNEIVSTFYILTSLFIFAAQIILFEMGGGGLN